VVLLAAACLVHVTPSPAAAQGDEDATLRQMVQQIVSVGQQQYDRGYYSEAEKTFQGAQRHSRYLDPIEQRKLESLRVKAGKAVAERKRIAEARQAAEQLNRQGDVAAARAQLESVRDSEFLTDQERQDVVRLLRGTNSPTGAAAPSGTALSRGDTVRPVPDSAEESQTLQGGAGDALDQYKRSIAETYDKSMAAYRTGEIDSNIGPAIYQVGSQMYTSCKYINPMKTRYAPATVLINMSEWQILPVEYRQQLDARRDAITAAFTDEIGRASCRERV